MSSSLDIEISATIESHFNSVRPSVPAIGDIEFPGQTYEPKPGTPWVSIDVDVDEQERVTMTGTPAEGQETTGIFTVNFHAVKGSGWLTPKTYRQAIVDAFNELRLEIEGTKSYLVFDPPQYRQDLNEPVWDTYTVFFNFTAYHNPA